MLGLPPRRALLYVPGDSNKKIGKAAGLGADVVCLGTWSLLLLGGLPKL